MSVQRNVFARYLKDLSWGKLIWIGLRLERKQPLLAVDSVMALEKLGLDGDHRCLKTPGSARQVTIISEESIALIAKYSGRGGIDPALLRRNLVVSNINLNALRHQQFSIGEAVFEATAQCHPCSRMDRDVGPGTVAAMLGHGGLCAKIIRTGKIQVGDQLIPIIPESL
ncbi:sulfurase ['Osedax' symbiont bacterium Rs2_46_30_T18]|nr:sulfurase ['Osedax' symbiont bacterium Rs2_46_30_T18]